MHAAVYPLYLVEAFNNFLGPIEQVTPTYSAVKHQGKKLYELARQGAPVPRKTRNISIHKISLFRYYPFEEYPRVIFDVVCSKGTYIRTLCSDLGQMLGPGAVMSFLVRTASGPFLLQDAIDLDEISEFIKAGSETFLTPMGVLVNHLPAVELKLGAVQLVKNGMAVSGQYFSLQGEITDESQIRLEHEKQLIGIGTYFKGADNACLVKPKKILI
jgi:tRNA pseudouridine55 synthase